MANTRSGSNGVQSGRPVRIAFDSLLAAPQPGVGGTALVDLWSQLPRGLAPLFRPGVPDLVREILSEINTTIPALAKPAESAIGKSILEGIHRAILQFLDRLADPSTPQDHHAQLFRDLGLHEIYEDPILDVLQTAYRVGARVAWRHMAKVGERAGISTATLCLLAEAIFAYIDELSALSVEGHASARASALGTLERRRRQLLDGILSADGDPKRLPLPRLAESARWPVPDQVVAVALKPADDMTDFPTPSVDPRFLVDLDGAEPCLLTGEEDQPLLKQLADDFPGWRIAVGPAVTPAEAGNSLRWARRMLTLIDSGELPDSPVTWFEHHMSALWLLNDPFLVGEISERALAPMTGLTVKQRSKLSETLLIWLETKGSAPEIAAMLDIHPQTVRYRLRQLERLFGDRLASPDARFALEVALRSRRAALADDDD